MQISHYKYLPKNFILPKNACWSFRGYIVKIDFKNESNISFLQVDARTICKIRCSITVTSFNQMTWTNLYIQKYYLLKIKFWEYYSKLLWVFWVFPSQLFWILCDITFAPRHQFFYLEKEFKKSCPKLRSKDLAIKYVRK